MVALTANSTSFSLACTARIDQCDAQHSFRVQTQHRTFDPNIRHMHREREREVKLVGDEKEGGPLGQGVANAVGLALAEAHLAARFNKPDAILVDHRTENEKPTFIRVCNLVEKNFVKTLIGKLSGKEGTSKAHHGTFDEDDTKKMRQKVNWSDRGPFHVLPMVYREMQIQTDHGERLEEEWYSKLNYYQSKYPEESVEFKILLNGGLLPGWESSLPVKTLIGKLSGKEGTSKAHHGTFDEDDTKKMRQKVNWSDRGPFHVLPMVYREMQIQTDHGERLEEEWYSKLNYYQSKYPEESVEFKILLNGGLLPGWESSLPVLPGLIGGSADLATSNKAYLHNFEDFSQPNSPWGRNIRYGVREHSMAGISNGLALHGSGLIPFAATFLIFSDYMKNSIRLSALSKAGVIYIMTHDSIGLGEDGPTHQPVEQLAGLRAVPRLLVFRPADGNETAGAYKMAVANRDVPSLIALSRQKVAAHLEGTSASGVESHSE
ncbi:transketolase-1 [Quercus suber]|uniref:transketolase n=1 Tax=Quercus suber TaxID=58331 RepID=A0AAW0LA67_QUESU